MALRTGWSLLNPLRTGPTQSAKVGALFCQQQLNRSFSAGSDGSTNTPPEETWLSKFFSFDVTRTSHSAVVGSQNVLYKLVFIRAYPEHHVSFPFWLSTSNWAVDSVIYLILLFHTRSLFSSSIKYVIAHPS